MNVWTVYECECGYASLSKPMRGQCVRCLSFGTVSAIRAAPVAEVEQLRDALLPFVFIGRHTMERLGLADEHDTAAELLGEVAR